MRYLLSILLIFCFFKGFAQPVSYRSNNQITVQDANLFAGFSLKMPAFKDTVAANAAYTLDSCGKLIYTYTGNKVYYRACSPKRWIEVTNGNTAGNFIDSLRYRSDSVYAKKNGQFIFQYRDSTANLIDSIKYSNDSVFAKKKNGQFIFQYIDSSAFLTFQDVLDNGSILNKNNLITNSGQRFDYLSDNGNPAMRSRVILSLDTSITQLYAGNNLDTSIGLFFNFAGNRSDLNTNYTLKKGSFRSSLEMQGDSLILQAGTNSSSSKIIMDSAGITFFPPIKSSLPQATASGTDTYTATIPGYATYNDGDAYIIKFINGNTTTSTLNINSFGSKPLYRNNLHQVIGGDISNESQMLVVYDSTSPAKFQCIGVSPNALFAYVTNGDTGTITKGQPVYAFSGTGDRMVVKLASNKGDSASAQTVGFVYSTSIAPNQKGLIMVQGLLDNLSTLPTSTFSDGDPVYLDSIPGGITNVKPQAPYHLVYLGVVTTASNGNAGRMYVRVQNGYEFEELHDVQINNPQNNQIIAYSDTVPKLWKNRNIYSIVDTVNTISTKYRVDTMRTNIYNQLAQELNVADTANMLTNYQRTSAFPIATFGAGSGVAGDTSAFTTSAIYGSFYLNAGSDTIIVTGYTGVVQGTSASVTPTIWFNDSLNVTAGATKIVNSPSAVTSTTTGNTVTSLDNTKIPPGNFVWVTTGTVTTKPTYFNLTLIGYRKRP